MAQVFIPEIRTSILDRTNNPIAHVWSSSGWIGLPEKAKPGLKLELQNRN